VLVASSRLLVWGAVDIAQSLGVSDLIIGLTVVAVGTSLPELASCVAAARKGEDDIALGNVLGSNLFNTLAVVGMAGDRAAGRAHRRSHARPAGDGGLTLVLFVMGWGFRPAWGASTAGKRGLLAAYVAYTGWLLWTMGPLFERAAAGRGAQPSATVG
jgi:cation:H+ antiporter